jgi:hypothetical protein
MLIYANLLNQGSKNSFNKLTLCYNTSISYNNLKYDNELHE